MSPLDPLPPLTEEQYAACFDVFLGTTSEHSVALDWVRTDLTRRLPRAGLSLLSVGAGDGRFDVSVCASLMQHQFAIRKYRMIEPDETQARALDGTFAQSPLRDVMSVFAETFEEYTEDATFDAVLFAHSLYYLPDRKRAIGKALSLLRTSGFILVFHQTEIGISQIQKRFSHEVSGHAKWSFNMRDLEEILGSMQVRTEVWRVPHWIDMSRIDRTGDEGDRLLSFFLEADLAHAHSDLKNRIWEYIDSLAGSCGPPHRFPHPLGIAVISPQPDVA